MVLVLGKILGRLYYRLVARQRRRAITQIRESLGLELPEAERIIRSLCCNLGQTCLEVLYTPNLNPVKIKQLVTIENKEYLVEALEKGKGVVVWTAHIGNWEWLGAGLALNGFPTTTVIKRQPNPEYTTFLNEYRQKAGIEVFASRSSELVGAARALKQGKILGLLADEDAGPDGIFISFLNKPASTPQGPAIFAKRFASPVVPAFIVRRPGGGHRIILHPPCYYEDTGNKDEDMYNFTAKLNKITETTIMEYPDEWLWFRKRWNTKPPESIPAGQFIKPTTAG
jgi:KDO2-lipid IV(A) lauroyltransferase